MITTIIFDMDGVIIDSEPIYFRIILKMFDEMGIDMDEQELTKFVGRSDLWETIKEEFDADFDVDEINQEEQRRFLAYLNNHFDEGPIDGVEELIRSLDEKNYSLVLASSSRIENINTVLTKLKLENYFPLRISGAELETSKPHPEIFLKAAELAKSEPEQCLVIEDSKNGVLGAKAAGMRCIGYKNPNSGNQDLSSADLVIRSYNEFDWKYLNGKESK